MNIRKKDRGITLIALAVTIIVMLILAGVTIATLTSENGIVTQARNTKIKSEIEKVQEAVDLKLSSNVFDKYAYGIEENIYDIDGFVKETIITENGQDKDVYIIKDLDKIGSSSTIGKGEIPSESKVDMSDLKDLLIIDQKDKVHYIKSDGTKFGDNEIQGNKKVVASGSEWRVEGNAVVEYLGTSNDIVVPNYVDDIKITKIGDKIFQRSTRTGTLTISEGIEEIRRLCF